MVFLVRERESARRIQSARNLIIEGAEGITNNGNHYFHLIKYSFVHIHPKNVNYFLDSFLLKSPRLFNENDSRGMKL
jgi:hypothetical protein